MPTVTIPDKPQKDFTSLELSASNRFGPGVSYIGGICNPAGPRSGIQWVCNSTADINAAFAGAGFGDDIVITAGATYVGDSHSAGGDGGQFTPFSAPAITATTPRMPPTRNLVWTAAAGLVETPPPTMTGTRTKVSAPVRMTTPIRQGEPSYIRVMSSAWASLPDGMSFGSAGRISPANEANMPVLQSKRGDIVGRADTIYVGPDTRYWRFEGIELTMVTGLTFFDMLVDMGRWLETNGGNTANRNRVPHHFIFDRCWFRADPPGNSGSNRGAYRGIHVGCPYLATLGCRFDGIMNPASADTQSLYFDTVPGPLHVGNTYFDSATEDMMIGGGGGPDIFGFNAMTDITIKQSFFTKNTRYYQDILPGAVGTVNVSGTTVTGSGTNFQSVGGGRVPVYFFSPGSGTGNAPVLAIVNSETSITLASNYGAAVTGGSWGLIDNSMLDCQGVSGSVTCTLSSGVVTRSSGTWPARVLAGSKTQSTLYFSRLNSDSYVLTRYPVTNVTSNTLTLGGSPPDASNVKDWMVGFYDGDDRSGTLKNLFELKGGTRVWLYGCVFSQWQPAAPRAAQDFAIKFAGAGTGFSTHITMEYCRGYDNATVLTFISGDPATAQTPALVQHVLWCYGDPNFALSYVRAGSIQEAGSPTITQRHMTIVSAVDSTDLRNFNMWFIQDANFANVQTIDNLLAYPGRTIFQANGTGDTDDAIHGTDAAMASLGMPQTNVSHNVVYGRGTQSAADGLTANGLLRTGTLSGSLYGNAGLASHSDTGFQNWTGDTSGDYTLTPLYTTSAGVCTVSGATVTISVGTIPTSVQKGTPFRVSTDSALYLTSVLSRDSGSQVTLAMSYPGTTGAGLTGVFTFQGSATDGTQGTLFTSAAAAATVTNPTPSFTETWTHANASSLTADQTWTQLAGSDFGIVSNQATVTAANAAVQVARCANTSIASPNMDVQVTVTSFTQSSNMQIGVCARFDPSSETCYIFRYVPAGGTINFQIDKDVAGTLTPLGTVLATTPVAPFSLKIRTSGTTITGFVNGSSVLSVTDSSITTGNLAGLFAFRNTASDSVACTPLYAGTSGSIVNTTVTLSSGTWPGYVSNLHAYLTSGDASTLADQILSKDSSTQITLVGPYSGTAGAGLTGLITGIIPSGTDPGCDFSAVRTATLGVDT